MFRRAAIVALAIVVLLAFTLPVVAAEKTHEGVVVSAADGKLVMSTNGKEHSHLIAATTKITIDGKAAKLTDLKKGDKISVTMDGDKVVEVAKK